MTHTALLLVALALVTACGRKGDLRPVEGASLPPAPVWAAAPPTPEEMLEPQPQAAPERVDDVVERSEERVDDPFDLPPPGGR